MKDNLKQVGCDFSIVLNENEFKLLKNERYILKKLLESDYLSVNICSVIKHDHDIDDEINQVKTLHYHCAVRFNHNFMVKSVIKKISDMFHINENQISVEKLTSLESYTRYLIHLDNGDKYHYCLFDIVTNNQKYVNECITKIMIKDYQHCIKIVQDFHYRYEVIIAKVCNYKNYNSLIKDLIRMRNL